MRLLDKLNQKTALVLDGGLATTLEGYGCDLNSSLWSSEVLINQPDKVTQAHQAFTDAGADIILTSTYQASFATFKAIGKETSEIEQLFEIAVKNIKEAVTDDQVVVGSLGPYGAYLSDGSEYTGQYEISVDEYIHFHEERINALINRGIYDFVFETVPNFNEIKAIVEYIIPNYSDHITFWISCTVDNEGNLSDGTEFEKVCQYIAQHIGRVPVFGINCSSIDSVEKAINKGLLELPQVIALYPNGGKTFDPIEKVWIGKGENALLVQKTKEWIAQGVQIIGGCCETTPEDIKQIHKAIER
ncbi:homocysteine S-methyltransferase [Mammaliicoccus sp. H-M34]|uniref:homocysteine S-methyltransferase n=1 Tax=Mammaliicoccus sp. H-M34 TaxID=2898693 RepID=UPI001EFBFC41|nr:homocysteine S-methyltransferase [Mammaliicoccus sp. H-M34]